MSHLFDPLILCYGERDSKQEEETGRKKQNKPQKENKQAVGSHFYEGIKIVTDCVKCPTLRLIRSKICAIVFYIRTPRSASSATSDLCSDSYTLTTAE